jgi:hypothetical protein
MAGDAAMDGSGNWEKCKLVLVRAAGGYMLQFYSPPKVGLCHEVTSPPSLPFLFDAFVSVRVL